MFRRTLKNINPDFLIIDEVLPRSPAYHKDEFDMSYDTDFYGNLLDVMDNKKSLSAIDHGLKKTGKNYPTQALNLRYIENHDMERFIGLYGINKAKLAASLLLTIPGTPVIYYGQEIGLTEKTPMMNWNKQNKDLFDFYKKLILLRRHHVCFRRGEKINIHNNFNKQVFAYVRQSEDEIFLVILNFGKELNTCQLLLPKKIFKQSNKFEVELENVLSSEKFKVRVLQNQQIKLKLEQETSYVLKIIKK